MWNNYQVLSLFANILLVIAVLIMLYVINLRYFKLPVFPLKEISVKGVNDHNLVDGKLRYVTHQQIEQIVQNEVTGNFFMVNLLTVQQAFNELPWVRTAKVYRSWPDGLNVFLEEHQVIARWGNSALVNTYGEIFRAPAGKKKLPLFIGPKVESSYEMTRKYDRFSKILEPLKQRIAEINLSSRYAWCIRLRTGTVLELGRGDVESVLKRYSLAYKHSVTWLGQQFQPDYMDLRYPNGFAVRIPESIQQASTKQINQNGGDAKLGRCN